MQARRGHENGVAFGHGLDPGYAAPTTSRVQKAHTLAATGISDLQ
jgi:hypothetical protein